MSEHIVYAGYHKGTCMYVGEGVSDRWKHLISGTSHVYEANQYHFKGRVLDIVILHQGLDKASAVSIEKEEILKRSPVWNKGNFMDGGSSEYTLSSVLSSTILAT